MSYKTFTRRDDFDVPLPPQSVPFQTLQNALFCEAQNKELQDNACYGFGKPTEYSNNAINKTKRHFEQYDDTGYDYNEDFTTPKNTGTSPTAYTNEPKCKCCNKSSKTFASKANRSTADFCELQEDRRDGQSTSHSRSGREPSTYPDASHMMTKGYKDKSCGRSVSSKFSSHSILPSKNEKEEKFNYKNMLETKNGMYENRSCQLSGHEKKSSYQSSHHLVNESHHNRNEKENHNSPNYYLEEKPSSCYETSREPNFFTEPQYDSCNNTQSYTSDTVLSKPTQHNREHSASRSTRSNPINREHYQEDYYKNDRNQFTPRQFDYQDYQGFVKNNIVCDTAPIETSLGFHSEDKSNAVCQRHLRSNPSAFRGTFQPRSPFYKQSMHSSNSNPSYVTNKYGYVPPWIVVMSHPMVDSSAFLEYLLEENQLVEGPLTNVSVISSKKLNIPDNQLENPSRCNIILKKHIANTTASALILDEFLLSVEHCQGLCSLVGLPQAFLILSMPQRQIFKRLAVLKSSSSDEYVKTMSKKIFDFDQRLPDLVSYMKSKVPIKMVDYAKEPLLSLATNVKNILIKYLVPAG